MWTRKRIIGTAAAAATTAALFAAGISVYIGNPTIPNSCAALDCFPNQSNTGTPAGWAPSTTQSTDLTISTPDATIDGYRLTNGADILVAANNVTIKNTELQGGQIFASGALCRNALIQDVSFTPVGGTGGALEKNSNPVIDMGGYTAQRIEVDHRGEGPRVTDCTVTIQDSYIAIQPALDSDPECQEVHSDGMQAVGGVGGTVSNTTVNMIGLCNTEGIRFPNSDANTGVYNLDHVLVSGAGQSISLGLSGSATGVNVVNNSWCCGGGALATSVCTGYPNWAAKLVNIDANFAVTSIAATLNCDGSSS